MQAVEAARDRGLTRILYKQATSTGKTLVFAEIIKRELAKGIFPIVVMAHRKELIDQAYAEIKEHCGLDDFEMGIEKSATHAVSGAKVIVGSVQTMVKEHRLIDVHPKMIITDECFVAGTLVDGRPIETIKPGDLVKCWSGEEIVFRNVTRIFQSKVSALVRITLKDGRIIVCTPQHPFFDYSLGNYKAALYCWPSDLLLSEDGNIAEVRKIERIGPHSWEIHKECPNGLVYNLEVEEFHNYFANGILVHNCHHAAAESYHRVFRKCGVDKGECILVGASASPFRGDRQNLYEREPNGTLKPIDPVRKIVEPVFEQMVYEYSMTQAMNDGYHVPYRVFQMETHEDISAVKTTAGDFNQKQLAETIDTDRRINSIIAAWKEIDDKRQTLVFCAGVKHARRCAEWWVQHGYTAEAISGDLPDDVREAILRRYTDGTTQVLTNDSVVSEGNNIPGISFVVIAKPSKSEVVIMQEIGRGGRVNCKVDHLETAALRRAAIAASNKKDCIAEGTLVLTDQGLVPIEQVTLEMKVWDGCEFVTHCGIICRGQKEVITYAGLTATPDHKIWTGKAWKTMWDSRAEQTPVCITGIGRKAVRETDGYYRRNNSCWQMEPPVSYGEMCLRENNAKRIRQSSKSSSCLPRLRESSANSLLATTAMRVCEVSMYKPEFPFLQRLRSAWDRVSICFTDRHGAMGTKASWTSQRIAVRQNRQQWSLRSWKSEIFNSGTKPIKHKEAQNQRCGSCFPTRAPGNKVRTLYIMPSDSGRFELEPDSREIPQEINQTKRRVWDIVNAGPRHRFTAAGVLVSNCFLLDCVDIAQDGAICTIPKALDLPPKLALHGEDYIQIKNVVDRLKAKKKFFDMPLPKEFDQMEFLLRRVELLEMQKASSEKWQIIANGYKYAGLRGGRSAVLERNEEGRWQVVIKNGQATLMAKPAKPYANIGDVFAYAERHIQECFRNAAPPPKTTRKHWNSSLMLTEKQVAYLNKCGYKNTELDESPPGYWKRVIGKCKAMDKQENYGKQTQPAP